MTKNVNLRIHKLYKYETLREIRRSWQSVKNRKMVELARCQVTISDEIRVKKRGLVIGINERVLRNVSRDLGIQKDRKLSKNPSTTGPGRALELQKEAWLNLESPEKEVGVEWRKRSKIGRRTGNWDLRVGDKCCQWYQMEIFNTDYQIWTIQGVWKVSTPISPMFR